jgi:membrane-bound lytic murein transglycosylase F
MDVPYLEIFKEIAAEYNLNWRLLVQQAWRESRWDPQAVGGAGEYGLMQIHPPTWHQWASILGLSEPFDPESNIRLAGAYWVWLKEQLLPRGRPEVYWLLAAYNWGITNVLGVLDRSRAWDEVPPEVQRYAYDIVLGAEVRAVMESLEVGDQ